MTNTQMAEAATPPSSPYDLLGGAPVVRAIVERFYDLMDDDPAYAELRAMHKPDLGYMRQSLANFLMGWMGGPRHWFEQRPGACMMSMHAPFVISGEVARQWADAMAKAIADQPALDPRLAAALTEALSQMALGMGRD